MTAAEAVRRRVQSLERACDRGDRQQIAANAGRLLDALVELDVAEDDVLGRAVVDLAVVCSSWAVGVAEAIDVENGRKVLHLARKARMIDGRPVPY